VSLSGTFATMPFPDLMQWLGDAKRTGTLAVSLEFEERYLKLRDGEIVSIGSDDARARDVARLVLSRGLIDETRLKRAMEHKDKSQRSLRAILVEDGYVPGSALAAALRAHAKDIVLQLFLWQDGRFMYSDAVADPHLFDMASPDGEFVIEPSISTREALIDGVRRMDEWRRMAKVLPSDYTVVHALGRAADLPALEALAEAGEPLALGDLCLRLPRPRFEIISDLFQAWRRGLLAIDSTPQQIASKRHKSPIDMLVHTATLLLEEKQFDEAAALLRSAIDLDPYHSEAHQLLHRARADQLEELYQEFPPYRVPVPTGGVGTSDTPVLSPREHYLLSRVDGRWDVGALTVMTPLGELETLRALKKFHHLGVITFR
jgi:hypothetical protein